MILLLAEGDKNIVELLHEALLLVSLAIDTVDQLLAQKETRLVNVLDVAHNTSLNLSCDIR